MANVRLLRQQLSDFNKKTAAEQQAYQDRYAAYEKQYGTYQAGVTAYNSAIQKAGTGKTPVVTPTTNGNYAIMSRLDRNGNYAIMSWLDRNGNLLQQSTFRPTDALPDITPSSDNMNSDSGNGQSIPGSQYLKNADGTFTRYDYKPAVMSDDYGNPYQPPQWVAGQTYASLPAVPVAPAEATAPAEIKSPNLTASNINELQNPGQTPADMVALANKGLLGKSELAGMEPVSKNSAFANPEDPNNLKEQGVLARTLAGQLG